jgi:hypothetical protein
MRLELLRDRLVALPRWKGETQAAIDAFQETAGLRHQDSDPVLRVARTLGNHFPQSISRPRIGSGIYPRFILHNKIFSGCYDKRGANTPIAAEIAGEGL